MVDKTGFFKKKNLLLLFLLSYKNHTQTSEQGEKVHKIIMYIRKKNIRYGMLLHEGIQLCSNE